MKRSPLRKVSKKRQSQMAKDKPIYEAVYVRSGGLCEFNPCGCNGDQMHHIKPKSKGGKTTEDNLLFLCHQHHFWIHFLNPAMARRIGVLK